MSFGAFGQPAFGSSGFGMAAAPSSNNAQTQTGPDLAEVSTEALGFQTLAGEAQVQLLPSPWPSDNLPPSTSSLLSIASGKGLLAAGGPDSVVIASTEAVRAAYSAAGGGDVKAFTPQLTLNLGTRISQVAFTADESFLVLSAENGGGLAVYDTDALLQGGTQSAFELGTGGVALRALAPNPSAAAAQLLAIVTANGDLMMADLKARQFVNAASGQVLKSGVSSVSWSPQGKQLVAGLGDGSATQMTPDGVAKAEFPKPANLAGDQHASAMLWLENNILLVAHTPSAASPGRPASTTYHIILRNKETKALTYRKLPEVCSPFGLDRSPPFQFLLRLRDWEPDLKDLIIVASTASADIGLFSRSSVSLDNQVPQDQAVNVFTTTQLALDSRRAQLPIVGMNDTSAIGMALDLSSKAGVPRPLPGEEIEMTQGPLPGLMILNNEGLLLAWWLVYADSVRRGTHYPGLAAVAGQQQAPARQSLSPAPSLGAASTTSAFGQSSFGQSGFGGLGKTFGSATPGSNAPAFGSTSTPTASGSAFGAPSALNGSSSAFGASTGLGNRQSPWAPSGGGSQQTAGAAFGQPAFGSSTPMSAGQTSGSGFGAVGGLGQKASPWATASTTGGGAAFGQSSGLGAQRGAFGTPALAASSGASGGSGFAAFASSGGFASMAAKSGGGQSAFAQPTSSSGSAFGASTSTAPAFGAPDKPSGVFGSQSSSSAFGAPAQPAAGFGKETFQLGSAWSNPNAGKADDAQGTQDGKQASLFGSGFGSTLGDAAKASTTEATAEADMMDEADEAAKKPEPAAPSQTPKSLFGAAPPQPAKPAGGIFGIPSVVKSTPPTSGPESTPGPKIKTEPADESATPKDTPRTHLEAPLPPDPTSKVSFTPGSSSASSGEPSKPPQEPPLPPDFVKAKTPIQPPFGSSVAPLPSDASGPSGTPQATALPASSIKPKPKDAGAVPLPPGPAQSESPQEPAPAPEDAPLPPDFLSNAKAGKSAFPPPALPHDAGDGLDDEGSGVDVAQDLSPTSDQSRNLTPESSFGKPVKSALGDFTSIGRPPDPPPAQGTPAVRPLFGEIGGKSTVPVFAPPAKVQQSPRSPSPVRQSAPGPLRTELGRSASAPGFSPKPGAGPMQNPFAQPPPHPSLLGSRPPTQASQFGSSVAAAPSRTPKAPPRAPVPDGIEAERNQFSSPQVPGPEDESELSEDEDAVKVRAELDAAPEPTLELVEFLAHHDYVGAVRRAGIPGQIERVHRDISSMLDTLGLNAKHLEAFTLGHKEQVPAHERTRDELSDKQADAWCLDEIDTFLHMQDELSAELARGALTTPEPKLNRCRELQRECARLRAQQTELKRQLAARTDAGAQAALQAAPLPAPAAALRDGLRRRFADFQTQLRALEEAVSGLRAALATQTPSVASGAGAGAGSGRASPAKVPTVEAVERTVQKMTAMAARKKADVEALEASLAALTMNGGGGGSITSGGGRGGRDGSGGYSPGSSPGSSVQFVTPPTSARRSAYRASPYCAAPHTPGSSVHGGGSPLAWRTPLGGNGSVGGSGRRSLLAAGSLASSVRSQGSDFRASVGARAQAMTPDDVRAYVARVQWRAQRNEAFKAALLRREVVVQPVPA